MRRKISDAKGKVLCNFGIQVISRDDLYMDTSKVPIPYIRFAFDFGDSEPRNEKIHQIQLKGIDSVCWCDFDARCYCEPTVSEKLVARYIVATIRQSLESAVKRTVYRFSRPGMFWINEKPVFCTGTEVIHQQSFTSDVFFEIDPESQKMDVDEELSEAEAAIKIFHLLSLSPDAARVILSYKLGYFMNDAYKKIGREPKNCIFLYGKSGIQKTTFSGHIVQTFERKNGIKSPSRLNASIPAAVDMMLETKNDVLIFDDLFPADSKMMRRKMEETLIEIVRFIGDGTIPARMKGKKRLKECPQCGVILTAEYLIGGGSDAARILPVEMEKPNGKELRYYQEHPLIVSTFYSYYIKWFIKNFDDVVKNLKKLSKEGDNLALDVHDRLRETYFFLGSSYFLFLQYCYQKGFLSEADEKQLHQAFCKQLLELVTRQNKRVLEKSYITTGDTDYLTQLKEFYQRKEMKVANCYENFRLGEHDAVLHNGYLYLRREGMRRLFPLENIDQILEYLQMEGVLKVGKGERSKQISALRGLRFYAISLDYLEK